MFNVIPHAPRFDVRLLSIILVEISPFMTSIMLCVVDNSCKMVYSSLFLSECIVQCTLEKPQLSSYVVIYSCDFDM